MRQTRSLGPIVAVVVLVILPRLCLISPIYAAEGPQAPVNLASNILNEHNTHLTTCLTGLRYVMQVLPATNQSDMARDLATQTTYPSWGYTLANGATTVWGFGQSKLGPSMNSQNHHMMGSMDGWFSEGWGGN